MENTKNLADTKITRSTINTANLTNTVGIGIQDFLELRESHNFYIDKTSFIKEWWESGDDVTLITRPRRFGKTLNMSMVEKIFLCRLCRKGRFIRRTFHLGRRKIPESSGDLSAYQSFFCKDKRNGL